MKFPKVLYVTINTDGPDEFRETWESTIEIAQVSKKIKTAVYKLIEIVTVTADAKVVKG